MDKLIHQFELGLFFWQILLFVGLIFLLKKICFESILDAVNDRRKKIKSKLLSAENAEKKSCKNLHADNQRILQEARMERDNMLKMHVKLRTK
jgi:F-type H+-transporting ATPase subunit b